MVQCNDVTCEEEAAAMVYWPGQPPKEYCGTHANALQALSDYMGWTARTEPLPGFREIHLDPRSNGGPS